MRAWLTAGRLATWAVAVTALIVAVAWLGLRGLAPVPTVIPSELIPAPTAIATTVSCAREPEPLPSLLADDPCPGAVLAVELAVAPVRLPIERIAIEPGPFYCDNVWPGVGSPTTCYGYAVRPGQFMHAWVRFVGSPKIAAVMLGLDLPADDGAPGATRPPWNATLVRTEIPPDGWVMP